MDLSIRKYIYAFLAFVCVMLSAASCVYDDDYDTEDFEKEALQFRVLAPDTKLTYNDLSTSFENDDVVGCVIASNNGGSYTFQTNTKWKYEDGVLMLDADAAGHIQKWKDDSDPEKTVEMQNKGYVQLLGNYNYAFFFYYPYVETTLDNTYPNSYNNPLAAQLAQNNWTSYPMFVHTDYDASGSNTKTLLNRTDHLWVGYTADNGNPINKENANHPVDLTFEKKTATIEIHCDIADGYSIENVSVSSPEKGIVRGVKLDLRDGSQTVYPADDYSTQAQNDLYTGNFTPGLIKTTEDKEKVYRMMLPAQTISEWNLNATLDGPSIENGPQPYSIPLQEKLSVLKEGELYILHIAKAGHGYIIINDWNNGGASDLIEDQTMPENLHLSSTNDRGTVGGSLLVRVDDELVVTGANLDYTASMRLGGVYVFKDYTLADDKSSITFNLPEAAKDGDVFLVTSSGIAVSAGTYVLVKPVATAVSSYSVRPGETLTITGTDLDLVTKVVFGGDVAADVEVNSEGTSLTVTVPDMAVTGTISFMIANGTTVPCDGLGEIAVAVPVVTDISALEGKFKAKATITISGSNLDLATDVRIKWEETVKEVEYSKVDVSTLTFIMPDEALDGSVYVIARSGAEIHAGDYTLVKSAATSYSPSEVEAGDALVITGTDLDLVKTVTFVGSSTPVEPSVKSETSLTVSVPDDGKTGALTLTLLNGTTVTCPELTFAQPSVTSMTGTRDKVDGKPVFKAGETVTLAGENLHLIKSIKLENAEVTTLFVSDDKKTLTFEMPTTAKDGTASYVSKSGDEETIGGYVLVKPVVTSGSDITVEPRESLTIEGTDLDLVTSIHMNNAGSVSFGYADGKISVTVPDNASTGTLYLNLANGTSVGIQLTVMSASGSVSTVRGDNDGNGAYEVRENETITVKGNNLQLAKSVKIVVDGGATHTVEVTDADLADGLSFELPSGVSSDGTIYLVNQYGYEVQAGRYEMAFPTGVSLPSPIKAGTIVTITGTDMDLVSSVKFHDNVTPEEPVISGTEIRVKVPDTAKEGNLSLVTKYGKTIYVSYTLVKPAGISYNPAEKAFVGEQLTINGSDMDLVTGVIFTGSSTPLVPDEGTRTDSSITVVVPAEAKTGQIYLNLANGTSVECPELTIDYPWCYITDNLKAMEIYSGSTIELNVANGSELTEVQVNGAVVSHTLSESKLTIEIPADAGKNTKIELISNNGSAIYTVDCVRVVWSGETANNAWTVNIDKSVLGDLKAGDVIIFKCGMVNTSYGQFIVDWKPYNTSKYIQPPTPSEPSDVTVDLTLDNESAEHIKGNGLTIRYGGGYIVLKQVILKVQ